MPNQCMLIKIPFVAKINLYTKRNDFKEKIRFRHTKMPNK